MALPFVKGRLGGVNILSKFVATIDNNKSNSKALKVVHKKGGVLSFFYVILDVLKINWYRMIF